MKRQSREAKDAQRIARAVLACPLSEGPVVNPEDAVSIDQLSSSNLDLFTRAVLAHGMKAANGDAKSMDIIMKLAGYENKQDLNLMIAVPTFYDDITIDVTPLPEPDPNEGILMLDAPKGDVPISEPSVLRCIEDDMEFSSIAEAARFADVPYSKFRDAVIKGKDVNGRHYKRLR